MLQANDGGSPRRYRRHPLFALAVWTRDEFGRIIDSAIGAGEAVSGYSGVKIPTYRPGQLWLLDHFVAHNLVLTL